MKQAEKIKKVATDMHRANARINELDTKLFWKTAQLDEMKSTLGRKDSFFRWLGIITLLFGAFSDEIAYFMQLQYKPGFGIFQVFAVIIGFIIFMIGAVK